MFTTQNHLFCLSLTLGCGKFLPQTVWALFQSRTWEIDTFLLLVTIRNGAMYVASDQKDWDSYLPSVTHAYNVSFLITLPFS